MGKAIKKLIILILIFITAIAAILWVNRDGETEKTYTVMSEAGLPVVRLIYGEKMINELHGYTQALNVGAVRETIYPLGGERLIPIQIQLFGEKVTRVGYEVRSGDGDHLIERNETEALTEGEDGSLTAQITLMDLMDVGREYQVILILFDGKTELARYYTRVRAEAGTTVAGAVDFALEFSEKTFLEEPDEMIIAQLESKSGADNSSLGYTDIYSSYNHVLWGNLRPKPDSEIGIRIHEFDRLMTSLVLDYSVTAEADDGTVEYYDVEEYYSIRYVNGKYYLMTYEREVDQDFCGTDVISDTGELELGIVSGDTLPIQILQNGGRTVFVQQNELRCYDGKKDELRTLFTFAGAEQDICSEYGAHGIRVVDVAENGDVEFLVYGYMNRGNHEGDTGICFYRYYSDSDALEEIFYISSELNYERIRAELGSLSYMNDNGLFYLMYEGSVYAIDVEGGEYVKLATGLRPDALSADMQNGVVVWQESDDDGLGTAINVYHLDSGENRRIEAPAGELIEMKGLINGDILYGLIRRQDREETYVYSSAGPIYALEIVSVEGKLENRYEQPGVYLTDVEILEDRVCFGRQRILDGSWETLEDEVLFCREEDNDRTESILESSDSERKKRTYALELGLTKDTLIVHNCPKLLAQTGTVLSLETADTGEENRYFAYNNGRLEGIFYRASEAIACIDKPMGCVVDEEQCMVWNRGNRETAAQIALPMTEPMELPELGDYLELFLRCLGDPLNSPVEIEEGENIIRVLQALSQRKLVDLEGCELSQLLYYLDGEVPVLGIDSSNDAVLLVGYYEAYGETTLLYVDLHTAEVEEASLAAVEEWFLASGNRFISAIP